MADINDLVDVQISSEASYPSRTGFGVPFILSYHTRFPEDARLYKSAAEMRSDDFDETDFGYRLAQAAFNQEEGRPREILIGRLPEPSTPHTTELDLVDLTAGLGVAMNVSYDGSVTAISVDYDTDAATTAGLLQAAIDAISGISASVTGTVVTVTVDSNGPMAFFDGVSKTVRTRDVTADWGYDTAIEAARLVSDDFFGIAIDVNSPANMADVATLAVELNRFASFSPQYTNPSDHSMGPTWAAASNNNVFSCVTKERSKCLDARLLGRFLPKDAGTINWHSKKVYGTTPDTWSTSERNVIEAYNGMYFSSLKTLSLIFGGKMHGGSRCDNRRGVLWLEARLQERALALMVNTDKIPLTDAGIQLFVTALDAQLDLAATRNIIDGEKTQIFAPTIDEIDEADRADRFLNLIRVEGRYAGAVNKVAFRLSFAV